MTTEYVVPAQPFLKWAGGKRKLLPRILPHLKGCTGTYREPFLGGGAVFFGLKAMPDFSPRRCEIGDANWELVAAYQALRDPDSLRAVIQRLEKHAVLNSEEYYSSVREQDRDPSFPSRPINVIAARMVYLNHTCFNGLYRVNKKGQFNVSWGKYKAPHICDPENLALVSRALRGVSVRCLNYEKVFDEMTREASSPDDLAYLDPPYVPVKLDSFTQFTPDGFSDKDHEEMARRCGELDDVGQRFLMSNSDCPRTRELYKRFKIEVIESRHPVNSDGFGRDKITELLIRNY
jgi:DNA adenine methylase